MKLVLEDGTGFSGTSSGAFRAITGYIEAITDPSYRGQILSVDGGLQEAFLR